VTGAGGECGSIEGGIVGGEGGIVGGQAAVATEQAHRTVSNGSLPALQRPSNGSPTALRQVAKRVATEQAHKAEVAAHAMEEKVVQTEQAHRTVSHGSLTALQRLSNGSPTALLRRWCRRSSGRPPCCMRCAARRSAPSGEEPLERAVREAERTIR
jgi:hypothetical protein